MKAITSLFKGLIVFLLFAGCGPAALTMYPEINSETIGEKKAEPSEAILKHWGHLDLLKDTVPGMSIEKAYAEILDEREGKTVIVGIIDSGIDIDHEDLKNVLWTNEDEIPGNGIDDDKNGYTDDVHGWNFLGDITHENSEFTRIVKKGDDGSQRYREAKAKYDEEVQNTKATIDRSEQTLATLKQVDAHLQQQLGKTTYTKDDINSLASDDPKTKQAVDIMNQFFGFAGTIPEMEKRINSDIERINNRLKYKLNTDFDGRAVLGDNPEDLSVTSYGDNNVHPKDENERHGTHVAGIVAAQRNNDLGMNGVAKNVKIMSIRTVPDGDEYDKDVALAIRYAVDNGAKVINGSFGKYFSMHPEWVRDAIKYAASKDVLIVKAAGNESLFLDENVVFPNDQTRTGPEFSDNFITVGSLSYMYGPEMISSFSNYGKSNVDVFAPGSKIWSTVPFSDYAYLQGTSMAAPAVAGIAALIRSYYPKLTAKQVKHIIMRSGLSSSELVILGGDPDIKQPFKNISVSGNMVNAYNAIIMADQVSRGKLKL